MLIFMDFVADLDSIATKKLIAFGYKPDANDTAYQRFKMLYTLTERTIPQQCYTVVVSTDLLKNPKHKQHQSVIDEISQRLRAGDDVGPYLSKQAPKLDSKDDLLIHGGVHHLHLSSISTKGADGFVARGRGQAELLFLRIENDTAYLIDIRPHSDKNIFQDTQILEIVDRNWPSLHFSPKGITGNVFSAESIKNLRTNNTNAALHVNGRAIYPTMGVFSDGMPMEAVMWHNNLMTQLINLEKDIRRRIFDYFPPPRWQWIADIRLTAIENKTVIIHELITNQIRRAAV